MSSCLSGGGGTYVLDLEILKSPPTTSSSILKSPLSSSPSSTVSESATNSPFNSISTRKPRATRKRPNQTYNEAAVLLSTACPKIFSPKHFTRACKLTNRPFPNIDSYSECLIHHRPSAKQPTFRIETKIESIPVPTLVSPCGDYDFEENDFDTESILDEEVGDGIDSIMGNPPLEYNISEINFSERSNLECGVGNRALKYVDRERDLCMIPTADIVKSSPKVCRVPEKKVIIQKFDEDSIFRFRNHDSGFILKLDYEGVQNAWSGRGSPFTHEPDSSGVGAKLEETENGGGGNREACVIRYKEKRRSRHFSKKIRYQVRKLNADRRPRMKGRFVRYMGR